MKRIPWKWVAAAAMACLAILPSLAQEPRPGGPGGPEGRGGRGVGFPQLPILKALDADGDGELSPGEIDNAPAALRTLDRNKDGKLTRDEMLPAPREGGPGGPDPAELVTRMMAFDKDGDGKLSKDELPERMQNLLDRADANKDGFVDKDELTRLAQQQAKAAAEGPTRVVDRAGRAGPSRSHRRRVTNHGPIPKGATKPMTSRNSPPVARLAGLLLFALATGAAPAARDHEFRHENVLGTSMELRVLSDSEEAARSAEARVLGEIDRLAALCSGYDAASEFRRWQATLDRPTRVSPELFELLRAGDAWRDRSDGAFDPRVQALTELWSRCARLDRLPTDDELAAAKLLMARPAWRLDAASGNAEHLTACPLSLNSIAKGDIIGRACDVALDRDRGVRGVLLNIGGDVRVVGDVSRTIGVAPPVGDSETAETIARVEVRDRSVATSGNSQRGFRIRGEWYSHIFDPRSGLPAGRVVNATAIAPRAADANALATTLNVLPVEDGLRLAGTVPEAECLLVTADGRVHKSDGWARYEPRILALAALKTPAAAPKAEEGGAWGDANELRVNFEIGAPEGNAQRYRRPYVAVWVEDKDDLSVRTLALWLQTRQPGPRWHPDLKRWYREDQVRRLADDTDLIDTVSRPTRPPGKYSVTWDGKDDHGKPLGPGKYTLCIEAAREHGTHQVIRKEVNIADTPFAEDLKGNVEIKSASIEYRRKGPGR